MNISLPEDFLKSRQSLFGDEWEAFLKSFDTPRAHGLRRNLCKETISLPFHLEPIPWVKEGYYYDEADRPGKHPLHEAGAYYIQEPSAMAVVSLLDPQPGEVICDLCAAPGGKSTQIASHLQGQGLLVSNEIIPSRAKILSQNMERMGVSNALVCNESPDRMADFFPAFFDRIVVDAPCSGEGMFRKDETAVREWSLENVQQCAKRQQMILNHADTMLKPGGVLVYSTCTFAPEEDEKMAAWFLTTHPDYVIEDWKTTALGEAMLSYPDRAGLSDGITACLTPSEDGTAAVCESISGALRLFPHKLRGEGHFVVRFRKTSSFHPEEANTSAPKKKLKQRNKSKSTILNDALEQYQSFCSEATVSFPSKDCHFHLFGDALYQIPDLCPDLTGIKLVRAGLHLGTLKKNRFEPSHALAKTLTFDQLKNSLSVSYEEALQYLKGNTLTCAPSFKGWILVCHENCPLGWGKAVNGIVKNHFPKGLRWL